MDRSDGRRRCWHNHEPTNSINQILAPPNPPQWLDSVDTHASDSWCGDWRCCGRAGDAAVRSETRILVVPQRVPESYVRSTVTTKLSDSLQSISQQILSRTRLERVIQDFDLYKEERRTGVIEEIVERMRKNIEVKWRMVARFPSGSSAPIRARS